MEFWHHRNLHLYPRLQICYVNQLLYLHTQLVHNIGHAHRQHNFELNLKLFQPSIGRNLRVCRGKAIQFTIKLQRKGSYLNSQRVSRPMSSRPGQRSFTIINGAKAFQNQNQNELKLLHGILNEESFEYARALHLSKAGRTDHEKGIVISNICLGDPEVRGKNSICSKILSTFYATFQTRRSHSKYWPAKWAEVSTPPLGMKKPFEYV